MTDNEYKLQAAFRETFTLNPDSSVERLAYQGHKEWDSIGHMALIAAIEGTFDIMLEPDEVIGLSDYLKAREIVRKHGIAL